MAFLPRADVKVVVPAGVGATSSEPAPSDVGLLDPMPTPSVPSILWPSFAQVPSPSWATVVALYLLAPIKRKVCLLSWFESKVIMMVLPSVRS